MTQKQTELLAKLPDLTHARINWQEWEEFNLTLLGPDGVVLVQFLIYHCARLEAEHNGWFFHTQEDIERKTGIRRSRFASLVNVLAAAGILDKKLKGNPARMFYKIRFDELTKPDRLAVIYASLDADRVKELSLFFGQFTHKLPVVDEPVKPVATTPVSEPAKAERTQPGKPTVEQPAKIIPLRQASLPFDQDEQETQRRNQRTVDRVEQSFDQAVDFRLLAYNQLRFLAGLDPISPVIDLKLDSNDVLGAISRFSQDVVINIAVDYVDALLFKVGKWVPDEWNEVVLPTPARLTTPFIYLLSSDKDYQFLRKCIAARASFKRKNQPV